MGNAILNKRVEETIFQDGAKKEYRTYPSHFYGGPVGNGDPNFRGLTKMEEDPVIPQRMRDIARTQMCKPFADAMNKCGKEHGVKVHKCFDVRDELVGCLNHWFNDPGFKERVTLEYLNERSHYRQTGTKTKRYLFGKFVPRDPAKDGPALGEDGKYKPQKPTDWDKFYKDSPPPWTDWKYD